MELIFKEHLKTSFCILLHFEGSEGVFVGLCLYYLTGGVAYCLLCIQSWTVSMAGLGVCSVTELLWYLVYFIVSIVSCIKKKDQ